jgi:selenide, water dikinase
LASLQDFSRRSSDGSSLAHNAGRRRLLQQPTTTASIEHIDTGLSTFIMSSLPVLETVAALASATAIAAWLLTRSSQKADATPAPFSDTPPAARQSAMSKSPLALDLVLIGGGHSHVHVLKMLGMPQYKAICERHGIQVTLITNTLHTPYSGMLPGYLSGHYAWSQIHLDLERLSQFSGHIRLVHARVTRISHSMVHCEDLSGHARPPVRYDCLSINVGSQPGAIPASLSSNAIVPVKPIGPFAQSFQQWIDKAQRRWDSISSVDAPENTKGSNADSNDETDESFIIAIVGGGAGGIELALSVHYRLAHVFSKKSPVATTPSSLESPFVPTLTAADLKVVNPHYKVILITRGEDILIDYPQNVRKYFRSVFDERHIDVYTDATVTDIQSITNDTMSDKTNNNNSNTTSNTETDTVETKKRICFALSSIKPLVVDEILWCATAQAPSWLSSSTPLQCTADGGFVRVDETYQSINCPGVFAAGDCAHLEAHPRPKSGVFAVRAGPYLLHNLVNYLTLERALLKHRPQSKFLTILTRGDKYAVASKSWWYTFRGEWVWYWKKYIDTKWMAMYTDLPDMDDMMMMDNTRVSLSDIVSSLLSYLPRWNKQPSAPKWLALKSESVQTAWASHPMRCGGCGAKVGASTVSRVLKQVHARQVERAKQFNWPLPSAIEHDDAAVLESPAGGGAWIHSIDYFRSLVRDPYIFGKIAAIHALSDCHAMACPPKAALVLAVTPFAADEDMTENSLLQLLSGVSDVLQDEQVQMIGGHTCEGLEMACGLSVQGYTDNPQSLLRKRGGQVGDMLVLTKPLGTGALFAANMRAKSTGSVVGEAIQSMLKSNSVASRIAMASPGIHACTDITGFGLIGHLLEVLMANSAAKPSRTEKKPQSTTDDNGSNSSKASDSSDLPDVGAVLSIRDMSFLEGGIEASCQGIFSSLHAQNSHNRRAVVNHAAAAKAFPLQYPLLYDPQTAGGLLFCVDSSNCGDFVKQLQVQGVDARVIGRLEAYPDYFASRNTNDDDNDNKGESEEMCSVIGKDEVAVGQRIFIEL